MFENITQYNIVFFINQYLDKTPKSRNQLIYGFSDIADFSDQGLFLLLLSSARQPLVQFPASGQQAQGEFALAAALVLLLLF